MPKRKFKKLTAEKKRLVWKQPESNAGAGWNSWASDPITAERGRDEEVMDPRDHDFNDD